MELVEAVDGTVARLDRRLPELKRGERRRDGDEVAGERPIAVPGGAGGTLPQGVGIEAFEEIHVVHRVRA